MTTIDVSECDAFQLRMEDGRIFAKCCLYEGECSAYPTCSFKTNKIKIKELELDVEKLKSELSEMDGAISNVRRAKEHFQKESLRLKLELSKELRNVTKDRAWIKQKCIDAGKELGKHSFAWDGKEKNLVVQAMQLNSLYENLQEALEEIKCVARNAGSVTQSMVEQIIKEKNEVLN